MKDECGGMKISTESNHAARFLIKALLVLILIASCLQPPAADQPPKPESRISVGMSRESALLKLADARKHFECAGYDAAIDDLFLYDSVDLEKATILYLKTELISGTQTVYHFGIVENYLVPASYGYCLGLSKDSQPSK